VGGAGADGGAGGDCCEGGKITFKRKDREEREEKKEVTAEIPVVTETAGQGTGPASRLQAYDEAWLVKLYAELEGVLKVPVRPHPVAALPSLEVAIAHMAGGAEKQRDFLLALKRRGKAIQAMERDPLRYGWEPFMWADAREQLRTRRELLLLGGNRSTKSEFGAKEGVSDLVKAGGRIGACFHSSEQASIDQQHPRMFKFLPPEWRTLGKKGQRTYVCYTEKGGFSDGIFILPNGSKCHFFNYKQDVKVFEGYEFDWVWFDELVPIEFVETMRFRLMTRRGWLLITFTPKQGYTPVVGDYLSASRIVKTLPSELLPEENVKGCPRGHMPYLMHHATRDAAILFFHTAHNAFNPKEELARQLKGAPTPQVKMRAYGWVEKSVGNIFPKFGAHNIIRPDQVPAEGTNYHVIDFAWARNWAMIWLRVTEHKGKKRIYCYRDWPNYKQHGEWVLPTRSEGEGSSNRQMYDGFRGPAQTLLGYGIKEYKRLILELEGMPLTKEEVEVGGEVKRPEGRAPEAEVIFRRIGDKRSGNAEAVGDEGGTTLIMRMAEEQSDERGTLPSMNVEPSMGDSIQEGVNLINEWLEYDDDKPISVENEPMFYVSEDCRQVIDCFRIWTGRDGLKGASKDFIDLPRYAAQSGLEDIGSLQLGSSGGGWGY
jgi:phage terminase large subunit-like protein